ncbi:hypothetical protein [Staphylococcus chromogenes]|uniref:hypothetical protein n=1 Tax=Staphylococcus chromogenes TaxID=46126 RepID=UPI000D1BCBDC|nr:hypothetical protein [Staphylococcus chromogenes]PTG32013.1 hypothetical protein BU634_09300 [Staphylococcus chromogenes]
MKKVEEKYIIEVNEGIYLKINFMEGRCGFTNNPNLATYFAQEGDTNAKDYAKKCGGKIKRFTATYEVE